MLEFSNINNLFVCIISLILESDLRSHFEPTYPCLPFSIHLIRTGVVLGLKDIKVNLFFDFPICPYLASLFLGIFRQKIKGHFNLSKTMRGMSRKMTLSFFFTVCIDSSLKH